MKKLTILTLLLATLLLAACGSNDESKQKESSNVLRFGYPKMPITLMLKETEALSKALEPLGYDVEFYEFATGAASLEALNSGNIDFNINGLPTLFAYDNGMDFEYLGGFVFKEDQEGVLVGKDSPIKSVKDLKGKKVAYSKASVAHHLIALLLQENGMTLDDIESVNLQPSEGNLALTKGDVDAWVVWNPFYTAGTNNENYRILESANGRVDYPNMLITRPDYLKEHSEAVEVTINTVKSEWEKLQKDSSKAGELISTATNMDPEIWKQIIKTDTKTPFIYMDEGMTDTLQNIANQFYDMGLISKELDISERSWNRKSEN